MSRRQSRWMLNLVLLAAHTATVLANDTAPSTAAAQDVATTSPPRVTLSVQNIALPALLQNLAEVAGLQLLISDTVRGNASVSIDQLPADEALAMILQAHGLGQRQLGALRLVAPLAELAQRDKEQLDAQRLRSESAPLHTRVLPLRYARGSELKLLLLSDKNSLLSPRGHVAVDERTNTLLLQDTDDKLDELQGLLAVLDVPMRQVLIESRIVIASEDFARQLGARLGGSGGSAHYALSGSAAGARERLAGVTPAIASAQAINAPTAKLPLGTLGWSILGPDFQLDLELQALQSEGRGDVIATPRVLTTSGKQALIEQGREIPFQTSSSNNGTNTQFKKAVLSLTVTPQITPDDRVIMDLGVTNDSQGASVLTATGGSAPAIDTRRLQTQASVRSGDTLVLGGVFQQESSLNSAKLPLLGDLPLLGALFRNSDRSRSKRELLIFVTPRIVEDGLATR